MKEKVKTGKGRIKQSERKWGKKGDGGVGGRGGSAKTFPQTYVEHMHMDGFNPVMVRLMSQTFLFSVRDKLYRFVLMMDDRAKRTPATTTSTA